MQARESGKFARIMTSPHAAAAATCFCGRARARGDVIACESFAREKESRAEI